MGDPLGMVFSQQLYRVTLYKNLDMSDWVSLRLFSLICYSEYVSWCHAFYITLKSQLNCLSLNLGTFSCLLVDFWFIAFDTYVLFNLVWAQPYMKAFWGGLYFIDWFCIWETGSASFCLGSDPPLTHSPNATSRVSLNVIKAAWTCPFVSLLTVVGQSGFSCSEASASVRLCQLPAPSLTECTALARWALRVFKEHCHQCRWK